MPAMQQVPPVVLLHIPLNSGSLAGPGLCVVSRQQGRRGRGATTLPSGCTVLRAGFMERLVGADGVVIEHARWPAVEAAFEAVWAEMPEGRSRGLEPDEALQEASASTSCPALVTWLVHILCITSRSPSRLPHLRSSALR